MANTPHVQVAGTQFTKPEIVPVACPPWQAGRAIPFDGAGLERGNEAATLAGSVHRTEFMEMSSGWL